MERNQLNNSKMGGGRIFLPKTSLPKLSLPSVSPVGHPDGESYIKDGLVFWLDGIDKGGEDGKWIDKVGGVVFTPDGDVEWGNNYVWGQLSATEGVGYPYRESTIEFVLENRLNYDRNVLWFNSGVCGCICGGSAANYILMGQCPGNSLGYDDAYIRKAGTHCLSANANLALHNLAVVGSPVRTDYWNNRANYAIVLPVATPYVAVHSIRIYDRLLSEEEMRHNQEVDVKRFNLSFPEPIMTLEYEEDYAGLSGTGV